MKTCTHCGQKKPLTAFSKHRLSKDGHAYQCKECNAKRAKAWRKTPAGIYTNLKGQIEYTKRHIGKRDHRGYIRHPRKDLFCSREEFIEWYESQPKVCVYCKVDEETLKTIPGVWNQKMARLTIDSKDNNKGYSLDNMVLACGRCNFTKSDFFTYDEMMEVGKIIRKHWRGCAKGEDVILLSLCF